MRKLWVGLSMGLLAVASPAVGQPVAGSQDPLSLITSGMVVPYFGGASQSWLEVASPIKGNDVHMFFYDETCVRRGDSAQIELTSNDIEFFRLDTVTPATSGLAAVAGVDGTGFNLAPLNSALHARVLWVTPDGGIRTLEPIAVSTRDNDRSGGTGTWNPLRTGATFFAPLDGGGINTTLYLVCPNQNIQAPRTEAAPNGGGAFRPGNGFPEIFPWFRAVGPTTPLRVRVYDDEENFLRDVVSSCNCLTTRPVVTISTVYADAASAPAGTYTELEGFGRIITTPATCDLNAVEQLINPPNANPGNDCPLVGDPATFQNVQLTPAVRSDRQFSFTGYRAITAGDLDIFGRLSNGCAGDLSDGNCVTPGGR